MIWRRRRSIVNPRQQLWFSLEMLVVVLGFIILCCFFIFIPPMNELFGGSELSNSVLDSLMNLVSLKWPVIMLATAIFVLIGMVMAHRLSGPLLGLQNVITSWNQGDRGARVRFRKYDYLISAMELINSLLANEEERLKKLETIVQSIEEKSNQDEIKKQCQSALTLIRETQPKE